MVHKHLQSPGATLPTCSRDLETASLAALCGSPCAHRGCPVVSERSETRDVHEAAGLSFGLGFIIQGGAGLWLLKIRPTSTSTPDLMGPANREATVSLKGRQRKDVGVGVHAAARFA